VIDEGLQRFAQRVEPLAVIDQLGVFEGDLLLVMGVSRSMQICSRALWAS
jgi:hypothetical protein